MYTITILAALVLGVSAYPTVQQAPKLVCYHTNWASMRPDPMNFTPDQIDPNVCTHLVYAFAKINPTTFMLEPYEPTDIGYPNDYQTFNDLKLQNAALKTLLAVGGWAHASNGFSDMVMSPTNRQTFIDYSITYLRQHGFDGIDLHWQYPTQRGGDPGDKASYTTLTSELRAAYQNEADQSGQERLLISMTVPGDEYTIDAGYEISSLANYVDFVNLVAYDLHGSWKSEKHHHTSLFTGAGDTATDATVENAVRKWVASGMPANMINLGFSLYGRTWMSGTSCDINTPGEGSGPAGDYTMEPGWLAYYEVCDKLNKGMMRTWDDTRKVPYGCNSVRGEWVGYDDAQSLNEKITYLKSEGLGGGMVWALDLDDYSGAVCGAGAWPLVSTLKTGIIDSGYIVPSPTAPPATATPPYSGPPDQFCVGRPDGYYPDPTDCHKFFHCVNELTSPGDCGTLAFNPICDCCDHPANVPGCV